MKPNLFLVGAPRCGTTALFECVSQHVEVFTSRNKEPHFFGSDLQSAWFIRDQVEYLALFDDATTERYAAEASALYLYSQSAAREIYAFNPDARIIISLRSPIEVIQSLYYHSLLTLNEDQPSLAEALAAEEARVVGNRIPKTAYVVQSTFYRRIARYTDQVSRYLEVFGRQRTHVLIFDDLIRQFETTYRGVLRFLDLDDSIVPEMPRANANATLRSRSLARLHTMPAAPLRRAMRLLRPLVYPVYRRLLEFNVRTQTRPPIDPALKAQLKSEFAPEMSRLSDLLQRDLTHWTS